jgi:hypothetical protein
MANTALTENIKIIQPKDKRSYLFFTIKFIKLSIAQR